MKINDNKKKPKKLTTHFSHGLEKAAAFNWLVEISFYLHENVGSMLLKNKSTKYDCWFQPFMNRTGKNMLIDLVCTFVWKQNIHA